MRLLAPLAYSIHSQDQQTSTSPTELIRLLAQSLTAEGLCSHETARPEAEQFLSTLSLRSGLLQYMSNERFSFSHLTFQEYLAARYIAAQPDHKCIDLVMTHMHESWWQEVHLLTIAYLGSEYTEARKASSLILTILRVYRPPSWILRSSRRFWVRLFTPGGILPQVQLERRIAWILAREFELAIKGYAECKPNGTTGKVHTVIRERAKSLVRQIIYDESRFDTQESLLIVICQSLQYQGNETVMRVLLEALHDADKDVRLRAVKILGQVGVGNEAVVSALLEALHDEDYEVKQQAARSLGLLGVGNEAVVSVLAMEALHDRFWDIIFNVLRMDVVGVGNEAVVCALAQEALHDADGSVRERAAEILGQVGEGNEAVVSTLLEALHDANGRVRGSAAGSLGSLEFKDTIKLRQVLVALNRCLHDVVDWTRWQALESIYQLLDGRPIPGYRLVPLQKRQVRLRFLKQIAILTGIVAVLLIVTLTITLLNPTSLIARLITSLSILAGIVSITGVTLRNLWERRQSN